MGGLGGFCVSIYPLLFSSNLLFRDRFRGSAVLPSININKEHFFNQEVKKSPVQPVEHRKKVDKMKIEK